jgi:hypothetical protein
MSLPANKHVDDVLTKLNMTDRAEAGDQFTAQLCDALLLWLRWNEGFRHLTAAMYEESADQARLERLGDELDQLRYRAVKVSEELLKNSRPNAAG